jgi:hypothetical protein
MDANFKLADEAKERPLKARHRARRQVRSHRSSFWARSAWARPKSPASETEDVLKTARMELSADVVGLGDGSGGSRLGVGGSQNQRTSSISAIPERAFA